MKVNVPKNYKYTYTSTNMSFVECDVTTDCIIIFEENTLDVWSPVVNLFFIVKIIIVDLLTYFN